MLVVGEAYSNSNETKPLDAPSVKGNLKVSRWAVQMSGTVGIIITVWLLVVKGSFVEDGILKKGDSGASEKEVQQTPRSQKYLGLRKK